ncbi:uncharacterized protein LOC111066314 [Drosophila obscura]|uniref:uncharacterized protein LOC111066314 n=1 Tax=Drosophila obscura TaxID=7282 RepID=UPI001BB1A7E4|nr:uncharacterized protein LOC111066314 [Drosophila obscura]
MIKRKHSVQNAEVKPRTRKLPVTMMPNAPSVARTIQTRAKMSQGTMFIRKPQPQRSLIVLRDPPIDLELEQEQDDILSVHDEEFKDLTDNESVVSLGSSRDDSCEEVTSITIDAFMDTTPAVAVDSSMDDSTTRDATTSPRDKRKRLIKAVHKRRVLYDSKHRSFHDRDFKNDMWRSIARRLSIEMENCVDIWTELRYEFQCHKRQMYNYKRKIAQNRPCGSRPFMVHEEEMCFLYPHVACHPLIRQTKVAEPAKEEDVVMVDTAQPVAIIDLDLDDDNFRITPDMRRLIEAVRFYPQLYNASHSSYSDYRHRGLIWGAISNELGEKATKLMNQAPNEASDLMKLMIFLIPHIPHMKESVYKTSKYLTNTWHDPIEQFRSVMTLVNMLKSNPELVQLTDEYLHFKNKPPGYHELWQKVATQAMSTPERCEVTWLVLRSFHSELVEMRLASYKLQDKWFFESTITTIYRMVVERTVNREGHKQDSSSDPSVRTPMARVALLDSMTDESLKSAKTSPRMPLAIVYPSSSVKAVFHIPPTTTSSNSSSTTTTPISTTVTTKTTAISSSSSTTTTLATATSTATASIATSTVSSSACGTIIKNDGLKYMKSLSLAVPNNTLKMTKNVSAILDGNPVPKVIVVHRRTPLPAPAMPTYRIRSGVPVVSTPPMRSPAPAIVMATKQNAVPVPPTNGMGTAPLTALREATAITIMPPNVALKRKRPSISVNGNISSISSSSISSSSIDGTGNRSSTSETETASEPNDIPLPAIANSRLQMQIISKIKVELLESLTDGNSLHIHGGALTTHYSMNMTRVASLIREVMAIPILHNSNPKLAVKKSEFWANVARKFHMPADACRAIWKFLSENISLFPAIAPMPDLMGPYKSYPKSWEKSDQLFRKFEATALKNRWAKIKDQLPLLMMHFRMYEHLYSDMRRPRPGELFQLRHVTQEQRDDVWRVANTKFPDINHMEVWSTFKNTFRTYMDDLELGIENPWPRLWWTTFDQLRFLVNVRYHPLEPYYYIVHTKIREEVKRCSIYEKMMTPRPADLTPKPKVLGSQVRIDWEPLPWDTEEAKRLLTGKLRADSVVPNAIAPAPPPAKATAASPVAAPAAPPAAAPAAPPAAAPAVPVPAPAPALPLARSLLRPRPLVLVAKGFKGATMPAVKIKGQKQLPTAGRTCEKLKLTTERPLPIIPAFEVTSTLRQYPNTFKRSSTNEKRTAWVNAANELNATVTDCRLSMQHALRELRTLKIADPTNQCQMGQNYYRHMNEIYKEVNSAAPSVSAGQLLVRTPQQLNETLAEAATKETMVPKRFIPEISMRNCEPRLVLKNWAHAMGSFSTENQQKLVGKLTDMFAKYAQASKGAKAKNEPSKSSQNA